MSRDEKVFGGAFGAAPKPFDSGIDIVACKANVLAHGFGLSGADDLHGGSFGGMRSEFAAESFAELSGDGDGDAMGAGLHMGAADAQLAAELMAADLDLLDVGGVSFGGDMVDDIQFDGVEFQI
jgi:hypothetical protein